MFIHSPQYFLNSHSSIYPEIPSKKNFFTCTVKLHLEKIQQVTFPPTVYESVPILKNLSDFLKDSIGCLSVCNAFLKCFVNLLLTRKAE